MLLSMIHTLSHVNIVEGLMMIRAVVVAGDLVSSMDSFSGLPIFELWSPETPSTALGAKILPMGGAPNSDLCAA